MPLYYLPSIFYLSCWVILAFLPYVFFAKPIYVALLFYFTGTGLYYSFYSLFNLKLPIYFKFLFAFVFLLCIYGFFLVFVGDVVFRQATGEYVEKHHYILWLVTSLLSSVPVYVFTCKGLISEKQMKILFFIFFVSCIYAYYGSLKFQMMYFAMVEPTKEEFTITCVYSFLSILPLVILFKNKILLQFVLIAVMFVYCVLGAKRGPVILGGISSILLILSMFPRSDMKKKVLIASVTVVFLFSIYAFMMHQMETSPYFAMRVDQTLNGYTSGRDDYAKKIYDFYMNSTTTTQFFIGMGAQSTLSVNESYAHNDWLGIALEQGLLGFVLYLLYWMGFVYTWIKSKKNYDSFVVIGLLFFIGFGKTLFSMYYLPISAEMIISSGLYSVSLGYFLAKAFPQQENVVLTADLKENG